METYREVLTANVPLQMSVQGKEFFITRSSAGAVLTVEFIVRQAENGKLRYVGKGLQCMPAYGFEGIKITSPVNCEVDFVITEGGFDLKFNEDESVIGNDDSQPVPVKTPAGQPLEVNFAGVVNPVLGVVTVDNADANAVPVLQKAGASFDVQQKAGTSFDVQNKALSVFAHQAAVAVGVAATPLIADATLKKLILRNDHATAKVALGGAGVTLANGPIVLLPGDMWMEEHAAGAAWHAISDTAATNVQVMGIK